MEVSWVSSESNRRQFPECDLRWRLSNEEQKGTHYVQDIKDQVKAQVDFG
jgi:hypothetical protein